MSIFESVEQAKPIEVFALSEACKADPFDKKVNLTIGAYRTEEGQPWVLPVVRTVESQMAADITLNKEYLPITGLEQYCQNALKILLGEGNPVLVTKKADGVQALGGTGALFLAYQFMSFVLHRKTILVSSPTWPNHIGIAKLARYENIKEYRYWDNDNRCVNFDGMIHDINAAPSESVIVMHACAHNPTGMDLTKQQWIKIAEILKTKKIFPIFDIAYQGFASGDLDNDAWAVRYFTEQGFELFACQSFSKNFGLYNERVGNLCIVSKDAVITGRVKSQMTVLVRQAWSNPPNHGGRIVATVLSNPALFAEWKGNVKLMADRVILMRQMLFEKLQSFGTPGSWEHVIKQIGMFSFTGLNKNQVDHMRNKYHIYMLNDGRINMCGLNNSNVEYVAKAIDDAIRNV